MAESGGSSRKKRQGGFGLFMPSKSSRRSRRRSAANGASPHSNTQSAQQLPYPSPTLNLPSIQGDNSQTASLGAVSPTRKNRSNPFAWLLGGRSDRRSRRSQSRLGNSSQGGQFPSHPANNRNSDSSDRLTPDSRRMSRTSSPTLPNLDYPTASIQRRDRTTESRLSRDIRRANGKRQPAPTANRNAARIPDQRVTALPGSSAQESFSKTLVPFPPQASRSESKSRRGRRRSPRTQLQVADTTLMQQPTALQQTTVLQSQDASADGQFTERSRQTEKKVLLRPRSRSTAIALYIARMLILSIGVGVLAGTVLSAWNPGSTLFLADASHQAVKPAESPPATAPSAHPASAPLELTTEITPLKTKLQTLIQQFPGFTPGLFLIDLDNYNYLDITGSVAFPAASTIKVPILIAFFQDVDAGKIRLDEKLVMRKELIAQGSGEMQYMQPGTQFTALETATQMIIVSDNTAANMLIARLGGIKALDERFKSWGLTTTGLKNVLPDLQGMNVISPKELASLMVRVSQGELVSMRSRDRMLSIMQRTVNNSQLPQGLGEGATIAHKTGDIGTSIGDVGLVDMPSGKRYAVAAMVKRSFNDDRAYELVQKMSSIIYQHLNGTTKGAASAPASGLSPAPTPSASPNAEEQGVETDTHHMPEDAQHIPDSELPPDAIPATNPAQVSHQ